MMLWRKLPAVVLALCLLSGPALAGGAARAACCARPAARPCCPAMAGGGGMAGARCSLHAGAGCSVRSAGEGLAVLHLHPELSLRPAVAPRPVTVPLSGRAGRLPEARFLLPASPGARPETPPPRLLPRPVA